MPAAGDARMRLEGAGKEERHLRRTALHLVHDEPEARKGFVRETRRSVERDDETSLTKHTPPANPPSQFNSHRKSSLAGGLRGPSPKVLDSPPPILVALTAAGLRATV